MDLAHHAAAVTISPAEGNADEPGSRAAPASSLSSVGVVGRDGELASIRAAFAAADLGRPTIVLLAGDAGIGKTRLAEEAAIIARAAGTRVLWGEADASSRAPMELWRSIYRALDIDPVVDESLAPAERRWEHLESLTEPLLTCAPVLVVLEDLHRAGAIAVWVLEHLPRALGEARVTFVATSRDGEPDMPGMDGLQRLSRVVRLGGLDVEAVGRLAAAESRGRADLVDPVVLHARTGGNPLFVRELVRFPGGSEVIGEVLERSFDRFDAGCRNALATAAVAGAGAPLSVLARACSCTTALLAARLEPALHAGMLDDVSPGGVRFHHALLAEAAQLLGDPRNMHDRLATAWHLLGGTEGRAAAVGHRLRAAVGAEAVADSVGQAREVATDLIAAGQQARAAGVLWHARDAAAECVDRRELRANVALDLAEVLCWLGDLDPALALYEEAAQLARGSSDPLTRARAEVGATLWASGFVPDLPRMRRLQDALDTLPPGELRLRAALLGRLTMVGGADVDATERVRAWAEEAVAVARSTGDPILLARSLLDQMMSRTTRAAENASIVGADEVVRLAERAGRSDLALAGHQRRAGYYLNQGDIGAASMSLGRAEVLAALLPAPSWRHLTLLQRTTLLALGGSRSAATASMYEAVRVGTGHVEPVVVLGCEALHQLMLFDLYGHADPRALEIHRITMEMFADVPSPVFQVQKGFGAQLFGDEATVDEMLHRYGSRPEQLLRSMTGDHLLRDFGDTVARAGARTYAGAAYRALLPYAGLLNVGGGHSAGLPVDDVLGRLAALDGDIGTALRHARAAVALARSMPSPPLLVHCLDHLADAIQVAGTDDADALRAEADALAVDVGVLRSGRAEFDLMTSDTSASATIVQDGPLWLLTSPLGGARLVDSNGLRQLARLLRTPRTEVSAVELSGRMSAPVSADLGPVLDARAKREYRQRLHVLQTEVDDAAAEHNPVRAERAHVEMESLLRALKRAVGLGGRDRPTGSDAERARVNVVRSLQRTVAAITGQAPLLGAHLETSVRTGRLCVYLPEPGTALTWMVRTAAPPGR